MDTAIKVEDVPKKFKVYYDKGHTFKEKILFRNRNRYEERWVLNGISFDVKKGEAIGLIGHNGCGKSTLLKLMTKIIYPDKGSISINGRISSLIELGAGFHPDMSGRENIYTNASIFGLTRKEIDSKLDTIIEFSELEEFIDNPVRTYSSGMYTRLAFSVAIHVNAEVLLIDEILAVGDAGFQAKCFEKLREIKASGTTIVIVSHSLSQIEQICERSIWIDEGKIRLMGSPTDVHPKYMEYMGQRSKPVTEAHNQAEKSDNSQTDDKIAEVIKAEMTDENGNPKSKFMTGEKAVLKIYYRAKPSEVDNDCLIGLSLLRTDKVICYGTNTQREHIKEIKLNEEGVIMCEIEKLNLVAGSYWFDIAIRSGNMFAYDYKSQAVKFQMYSNIAEVGVARLEHSWKFE